ncbi:hypothetical protein D3C78_1568950 [compost metagenome]
MGHRRAEHGLRIKQTGQGAEVAGADHFVPLLQGFGDAGLQVQVSHVHSGIFVVVLATAMTLVQSLGK